jgi:replicative DNA helicase
MKPLPHSDEAERAAIGCMLLDCWTAVPLALAQVKLTPKAFWNEKNRKIIEAIFDVFAAGRAVDAVTVTEALAREGDTEEDIGAYLDGCVDAAVSATHAVYYFDIVRQKEILRQEIELCREIAGEAFEQERGDQHLKTVTERFAQITDLVNPEQSNKDVMECQVQKWRDAKEGVRPASGLPLPWRLLNELLCGLEEGLTILAARPSMGKTTIEDEVCCALAQEKIPVARVTLDSSRRELLARAMCRKAGVSMPKLKFGYAGGSQLARIEEARETLAEYPMWINDVDRDWRQISSWARMMKMRYGVRLLTVDYIQLIGASEMGKKEWDNNTRVSFVSGALKKLSLELEIPVLVLSQLSRAPAKDDREPRLDDLRDSGAIEQDAAKVIFVYRDETTAKAWEEKQPGATKHRRPMWIDVLKHKEGELGRLPYVMYPPYFRFAEVEDFELGPAYEGFYPGCVEDERD